MAELFDARFAGLLPVEVFLAEERFAGDFLADDFDFLADDFLADDFLRGDRLADEDFFAEGFFRDDDPFRLADFFVFARSRAIAVPPTAAPTAAAPAAASSGFSATVDATFFAPAPTADAASPALSVTVSIAD